MLQILFSSKTRVKLLCLFIINSPKRFYLSEIIKLTHTPLRAVQRELVKLETTGLLIKNIEGNRVYFQINTNHFIFPELKILILKTVGFGDILRDSLQKEKEIEKAFIYGSYAENKETAKSDIDLFIVGRISGKKLMGLLKKTARTFNRPINPAIYSPEEFKRKKNSHFINSILKKPKIFLVGNKNAL